MLFLRYMGRILCVSHCVCVCVCVCVLRGGVFLAHTGPVLGSSAFFQWFQPFSLGVRAKSGI
jgi:hypothetical protein